MAEVQANVLASHKVHIELTTLMREQGRPETWASEKLFQNVPTEDGIQKKRQMETWLSSIDKGGLGDHVNRTESSAVSVQHEDRNTATRRDTHRSCIENASKLHQTVSIAPFSNEMQFVYNLSTHGRVHIHPFEETEGRFHQVQRRTYLDLHVEKQKCNQEKNLESNVRTDSGNHAKYKNKQRMSKARKKDRFLLGCLKRALQHSEAVAIDYVLEVAIQTLMSASKRDAMTKSLETENDLMCARE